jgi:hypothetical protein
MTMENRWQRMDRCLLAVLAFALAGCGGGDSGSAATDAIVVDYSSTRVLASLYSQYLSEHKNQAPPNEQAFREFLGTKQETLERAGLTIDDMFASPRNGQPLEWVYGRKPPAGRVGTYFAYEKTPVDGKRLVIATRGMYEEMDEAQFNTLFRKAR